MLTSDNDNVIGRFFEAIAVFWNEAAKYQIFVLLLAVALISTMCLFKTSSNDTVGVLFNAMIFSSAAIGGFLLFKLKGTQLAAFTFVSALLLRICFVFIIESSTPIMQDDVRTKDLPWTRHYDTMLFVVDEFFYVYQEQRYKDVTISEFISSPELMDNEHRVSFLMSRVLEFFGDEFIWYRITGAFFGAFAAAIICLTAQEFFGKSISTIVSLLSVAAPQTVFYSVGFLKEVWVIFAASLILWGFALIIRNKKPITAILSITAAIVILMWMRFEYGLMFIIAIPIAVYYRNRSNLAIVTFVAILSVILLGSIIFFYRFDRLTHKAEGMLDKYTITEQAQHGRLDAMDGIYKSRGPLRLLNIPLALLNPPPKNLHHIFTLENGLYDIVLQADIYQWWLLLPFLTIGTVIVISRRIEFLSFLLPYIIAISTSALLIGGQMPGVYRYRDSLVPAAFIIIGVGIESLIAEKKMWENVIILSVYALFVMLAVYFYLI
jgi:hypothetical protein